MKNEVFKSIIGFEDYQVSSFGVVKTNTEEVSNKE